MNNFFQNYQTNFSVDAAKFLFRWYYAAAFYIVYSIARSFYVNFFLKESLLKKDFLLWPVAWLNFFNYTEAINFIFFFALAGTFLAMIFPEKRIFRIWCFLGIFEIIALVNSDGSTHDHAAYLWIPTSFLAIFLPDDWKQEGSFVKRRFSYIFWGCQAVILLAYSMSGFGKLLHAFFQILDGEINLFSPYAGALHIADRLVRSPRFFSPIGGWLIEHYLVAWMFLLGTVYLEFFSFFVSFRPSVQRLWGAGLILFHVGIFLSMSPNFLYQIILLTIFFLWTPIQKKWSIKDAFSDLPILGFFLRRMIR